MKIGVFDSGVGGRNILKVLRHALPEHSFVYACDSKNVPYGSKTPSQIVQLARLAIRPLVKDCKVVVVACNTATSYAIETLRRDNRDTKFVGLEPPIKPAARLAKTGVVAVCATPATLKSINYQKLKNSFASQLTVIEPDCTDWATLIEQDRAGEIRLEQLAAYLLHRGCDTVVLGCTHYHALRPKLQTLMPNTTIIDPSYAVLEQVKRYL
jgi:glutamate racemase